MRKEEKQATSPRARKGPGVQWWGSGMSRLCQHRLCGAEDEYGMHGRANGP